MPPFEIFIPFNNFRPGSPEHGQGLLRARNAIPCLGSWRAMPARDSDGSVVSNLQDIGIYCHPFPSGLGGTTYSMDNVTEFHGTEANLYTYDRATDTFAVVSRGGGYAAGALVPSEWNFASFGNHVLAANAVDPLQIRVNNAGNFADVAGSVFIPVPRFVTVVREFPLVGFLNQANRFADEIAWSDINDAQWWDDKTGARPASLAGSKRIASRAGALTGLLGGEFGRAFKRRSIHAIQSSTTSDVFRLDEISGSVGCWWPRSLVDCSDGFARFWGGNGFYRQAGLGEPEKISPASLDDELLNSDSIFNNNINRIQMPTQMWHEGLHMVGAESRRTGLVVWLYRNRQVTLFAGLNTRLIVHDPATNEWGLIELDYQANGQEEVANGTGWSFLASSPIDAATAGTELIPDIVGGRYVPGTGVMERFHFGIGTMGVTYVTQRFPLSLAVTGQLSIGGTPPTVECVLPVMSRSRVTASPRYEMRDTPTGTVVRVIGATDPHFAQQTDAAGTIVSPRSVEASVAAGTINSFGWFATPLSAPWIMVEMEWPEGVTTERGFEGVYVRGFTQ